MHSRVLAVCSPLALLLFTVSSIHAQSLIPQIADGGGWQTTLVLTNTGPTVASANLSFFKETAGGSTENWNLSFLEDIAVQGLSLPAAGTVFLRTPGTSPAASVGWGLVQASSEVVAYSIFTYRTAGQPDQEGTASAVAGDRRILLPFDNTSGLRTAIAVVNPTSVTESVNVNIRTDAGTVSAATMPALPAQGHASFFLPQQFPATAGRRGLMEFDSGATGSLSMIALRFNPTGAFTSAPTYPQSGPTIIGSGGVPLPMFSSIRITALFSPQNQPNYGVGILIAAVGGRYSVGTVTGTFAAQTLPTVIAFTAAWESITLTGQTFTLSDPQLSASSMTSTTSVTGITSASLTVTLSTQGVAETGTVTGSMTLVSSLATLSGPITGSYLASR